MAYTNILTHLQTLGDFSFALSRRDFPILHDRYPPQKPALIVTETLASTAVHEIVQKGICQGLPEELIWKHAREIAKQLGHNLDLTWVRPLAFAVKKIVQKIFTGIFVNEAQIPVLRRLFIEKGRVVFLPTHRSYMDFIILTFLFFYYELPLPAIAAAMDFMGMKGMSEVLRRNGAFYIRRNGASTKSGSRNLSKSDAAILETLDAELYSTIFTEYVRQHMVVDGERPLEFFLEGTRSRSGKSLPPKVGLLSIVLQAFLRGDCEDVTIIPVSMQYDRILEERLYGYEMLGIPKPKESTSGLVKASSVLSSQYGNIHVHFGEPISARKSFDLFGSDYSSHCSAPISQFKMTDEELELCKYLARQIVRVQNENMNVSSWHFVCLAIGLAVCDNKPMNPARWQGITQARLVRDVEELSALARTLGYKAWVRFSVGVDSWENELIWLAKVHSNLIKISESNIISLQMVERTVDSSISRTKCPLSCSPQSLPAGNSDKIESRPSNLTDSMIEDALPWIMMNMYSNSTLFLFADSVFVLCACFINEAQLSSFDDELKSPFVLDPKLNHGRIDKELISRNDNAYIDYVRLRAIFQREFVRIEREDAETFSQIAKQLERAGFLNIDETTSDIRVQFFEPQVCKMKILLKMFSLFFNSYFWCAEILSSLADSVASGTLKLDEKSFCDKCQAFVVEKLNYSVENFGMSEDFRYSMLSRDIWKNAFGSFISNGAIVATEKTPVTPNSGDAGGFIVDKIRLAALHQLLLRVRNSKLIVDRRFHAKL